MKTITNKNGYSLVEVLVAISILMLSIVGPITIAAKSLQSAQYARQQNTAFFLAQEGISAINAIRNDAALSFYNNPVTNPNPWIWATNPPATWSPCFNVNIGCNIDFRDATPIDNVVSCATLANCTLRFDESQNRAVYTLAGSGVLSPYRRIITLQRSPTNLLNEVLVTSRVEWTSGLLGGTQVVTLSTSLFNVYK